MPDQSLLEGNFRGLQHIGLPVTNLQVSVDYYSRLGFSRILDSRVHVPEENDNIFVAMMERSGVVIELYQVTMMQREELIGRNDGHLDHIAFDVIDIDKAYSELKNSGFTMVEKEPVFLNFWKNGCRYFAVRGPDGEKLEFNQIL